MIHSGAFFDCHTIVFLGTSNGVTGNQLFCAKMSQKDSLTRVDVRCLMCQSRSVMMPVQCAQATATAKPMA